MILGGFVYQVNLADPYHEDFGAHHFEDVCLCPYSTRVRFILCHTENVRGRQRRGLVTSWLPAAQITEGPANRDEYVPRFEGSTQGFQ